MKKSCVSSVMYLKPNKAYIVAAMLLTTAAVWIVMFSTNSSCWPFRSNGCAGSIRFLQELVFDVGGWGGKDSSQHLSGVSAWIDRCLEMQNWRRAEDNEDLVRIKLLQRFREYQERNANSVNSAPTNAEWHYTQANIRLVPACQEHKKWAVITTIASAPTRTMEAILEQQEWCLVVVGDVGSPTTFPEPPLPRYASLFIELKTSSERATDSTTEISSSLPF
jgi:hypothetical protein